MKRIYHGYPFLTASSPMSEDFESIVLQRGVEFAHHIAQDG